ncbi:MAG: hypothetical protein M1348_02815 [Candidatus Parvarchaeota archaeon]|jgi:hypothetical protein|nr:hypothetical protein [Candidatus Parvarchaeota archaeon]
MVVTEAQYKNLVVLTRAEIDQLYVWRPIGGPVQCISDIPRESDLLMLISESMEKREVQEPDDPENLNIFSALYKRHTKMQRKRRSLRLPPFNDGDEFEWIPVTETVIQRIYQPIKITDYKK